MPKSPVKKRIEGAGKKPYSILYYVKILFPDKGKTKIEKRTLDRRPRYVIQSTDLRSFANYLVHIRFCCLRLKAFFFLK